MNPGQVPKFIKRELEFLFRERDRAFQSGDIETALRKVNIANQVFCAWYYRDKPKYLAG